MPCIAMDFKYSGFTGQRKATESKGEIPRDAIKGVLILVLILMNYLLGVEGG
jgi:hypothetical protein